MATRRHSRVVGLAIVIALAVAFLMSRLNLHERTTSTHLEDGLTALRSALDGDTSSYDRAERAFSGAAGNVVFDAFPLFALEMTRLLRAETPAPPATAPVLEALRARRFEDALVLASNLPSELSGRDHLLRLVSELHRCAP